MSLFLSISDGKYLSLEDCTSDQCHEAGLSRITRAVCVLQCFLKTSSTGRDQFGSGTSRDLTAVGTDLRGRELDPVQACIEAKCLDSQHYMQCAYDRCLTSKRRTRQSSDAWKAVFQRTDPDQIQDWLRVRSKRPIELCSGCFPNSSSWPQCRSSCGK